MNTEANEITASCCEPDCCPDGEPDEGCCEDGCCEDDCCTNATAAPEDAVACC